MSSQSYIYNPTERTLAAAGDGFSCPRLTTAGRTALSLTANDKGMMVYDTTLTTLCIWTGAAWEFINDSSNTVVNVKDYGAVGDGVTNDANAFTLALEACRLINNAGYCPILVIPYGTYLVTFAKGSADANPFTNITSKSFYAFNPGAGANQWNPRSSFSSGSDTGLSIYGYGRPVILTDGDANSWFLSTISYFTIDLSNVVFRAKNAATVCNSVALYRLVHSQWNNVTFENYQLGVAHYMTGCTDNFFKGYGSFKNRRALVLGSGNVDTMTNGSCTVCHFTDFEFTNNGTNFTDAECITQGYIEINAVQNCSFTNGTFQSNYCPLLIKVVDGLLFKSSYFENLDNGRTLGFTYTANFNIDPTIATVVRGTDAYISGLTYEECFLSGTLGWIVRASANRLLNAISVTSCNVNSNNVFGWAYVTGETQFMSGFQYYNCTIYDDAAQTTLSTSYPVQYQYNGANALILPTQARVLPITLRSPNYSLGLISNIKQSAFRVLRNTNVLNATGDGTAYDVVFDLKAFDQNNDFAVNTSTFTVPITGVYQLSGSIFVWPLLAGHTAMDVNVTKNGGSPIRVIYCNPYAESSAGNLMLPFSALGQFSAGDLVRVQVTISGSTKTVEIVSGTFFSSHLVA